MALNIRRRLTKILVPLRRFVATAGGAVTQFFRPDADINDGSWTVVGTADFFDALNETSPNDSDYIQSPQNPVASACSVSLSGTTGTPEAGTVKLVVRHLSA